MIEFIKESIVYILLLLFLIVFACGSWMLGAYMEARSFSRITGEQVTTWDAMWVELRVDRPVIKDASK
jgi:hypothetical protein